MFQWLALFECFVEDFCHGRTGKKTHQVVFKRNQELGRAVVALARASAAQLTVDSARLVAFRTQDIQPSKLVYALAKLDVGASARHVGCDCDRAPLPCLRDNFGFLRVVFGIQNIVGDFCAAQHSA